MKLLAAEQELEGYIKIEIMHLIDGEKDIRQDAINYLLQRKDELKKIWPYDLFSYVFKLIDKLKKWKYDKNI
jgi:hypothetical protein